MFPKGEGVRPSIKKSYHFFLSTSHKENKKQKTKAKTNHQHQEEQEQ
jgi:hypothetical protein